VDWLGVIRGAGIRGKKSLGQSFIVHEPTLDAIVEGWGIGPEDEVFEIGSGPGNLTAALGRKARRVWAVEIDHKVALVARRTSEAENVIWIEGDALDVIRGTSFGQPMKVVGNLPYSTYREILLAILEWDSPVVSLGVTLQKDVARKIFAPGSLSVLLSSWRIKEVMAVPRNRFYPQPRVDSTCLHLVPRGKRKPIDARRIERGLKRLFSSKGRTLGAFAKKAGLKLRTDGRVRIANAKARDLLDLADRLTRAP
jgi:16S rRNA (adenine1518-N6/adenine1519-N6)-dimethyltransferase